MTPEQVAMVRTSYAALGADRVTMANTFYRRLFAGDPSAKELFSVGSDEMSVKFSAELEALVEAIASFPDFAPRARELGIRHGEYRVQTRHYHAAREALIDALAEHLAPRWNAEMEEAWRRAYNLVAEMMMAAAVESEHDQRSS